MQIVHAIESLHFMSDEFDNLLATFHAAENPHQEPMDMDWPVYRELEDGGSILVFTARDGRDKLIGVVMYIVCFHLHHKTSKYGTCDIMCVNPQYRGQGIASGLMEVAENKLKSVGVTKLVHMSKSNYDVVPLFKKKGFLAIETAYIKEVT